MASFDPRGQLRGFERDRVSAAIASPDTFIAGNPASGFYETPVAPHMGYWGVTFRAKRTLADLDNPGNLLTWTANRLSNFMGSDKRFVSVGAAATMRASAFGDSNVANRSEKESVSIWKYLSNRFSPLQDVSNIDRILSFKDEKFDGTEAVRDLIKHSPEVAASLVNNGRDLRMLEVATNRDAFQLILMREQTHIQALQSIKQYNNEIGAFKNISSKIISGAFNYMLVDPTFAPSLAIGVGGAQLSANTAKAGVGILRLGAAVTRARSVAQVAGPFRVTANAVTLLGGAPAAAYGALAGRWGVGAATGVELAGFGMAMDIGIQQERINDWNIVFEGTEWQREFSYGELALSGLIGGSLGYVLGNITKAMTGSQSVDRMRRATIEAADGDPNSIISREGFIDSNSIRAQAHEDTQAIRIQELSEIITGGQHADLGMLIDRAILDDAGLMADDAVQFLESIAEALSGDVVDSLPVIRLAQELLAQAKAAKQSGDVFDEVAEMLMRQAQNRALMQALSEGLDKSDTAILRARVDELTFEHMESLRRQPTEKPVGMRADMDEAQLRTFIVDMDALASKRTLTDLEESQMLWAARSLEFATGKELVVDIAPRFDVSNFQPKSDFGKRVVELYKDRIELATAKRAGDKAAVKRIQQRIRRRVTRVREVFPSAIVKPESRTRAEIASDAQKATTPADRERAFGEWYDAPDANAAAGMENHTIVGRVMHSAGLGKLFTRLATEKTGTFQTVRSAFATIRQLSEMFDHSRFTVEAIRPDGAAFVGNLTDRQAQGVRQLIPMTDFMDKLSSEGFFGGVRDAIAGRKVRRIKDFETEVYLHAKGIQTASTPEARELADMWTKIADDIGKEGLANSTLKELSDNFAPKRVEIGTVMRDRVTFREALTRFFTKDWLDSNEVHLDTLVTLGWAERVALPGQDIQWKLIGPVAHLGDGPITTLQRSQLGDLADKYTRGLTEAVDENGLTGIGASMRRTVNNLTNERTFVEESGRVIMEDAVGASSKIERKLDDRVLEDPELIKFFRTDMMSMAHDYVRHTGLDIKANSLAQEVTGIKGLTFMEYVEFTEKQLTKLAKEGTDEAKQIRISINEIKEKWAHMSGRERRIIAEAEKVGEFFSETAQSGTMVFFAGGIGQAIATTEVFVGAVLRNYNVAGFVKQLRVMFEGINPVTHKRTFKEYAGYTSLATRLNQRVNAERFTGGSIQSDFQYGTIDKMLAPWRSLIDNVTGRTAIGPRNQFGKATVVPQAISALGQNSFIGGGADYFTRIAWTLQLVSLSGETARFLPAAVKLTNLIAENKDVLRKANQAARDAAPNLSEAKRAAVGDRAELKVWKGLARKAGFGSRWQVARRFGEHKMLDNKVLALLLEAGEATGSLKTKGALPMMDLQQMSKYVNDINPERAADMQDALNRVIDSFEKSVKRRVSEQGILQTPTNEASRTYHGRMLNAMTTFSRSFFDNNILDMANMPSRNAVALATAFVLGETMNRVSKRVFNGEDLDVIMDEFEDRPAATMLNYALNLPVLGQYNFMLRAVTDPILTDTAHKQEFTQGAAVSVANEMLNFTSQAIRAPFDEEARKRMSHSAEKFGRRFVPGLNSHYGGLFLFSMDEAFGTKLRMQPSSRRGGRNTPDFRFDFDTDRRLINGQPGDILPPEDNITDFSFMLNPTQEEP